MDKKTNNDNIVLFDVDGTLVDWDNVEMDKAVAIDNSGTMEKLMPMEKTIVRLKQTKMTGAYIIVWSANGDKWAEAVCKALDLDEYVDRYMTKPRIAYDDQIFEAWVTRIDLNKKKE